MKVFHRTPTENKPYAILPCGRHYNQRVKELMRGDKVEFWTDWRHDTLRVLRACVLQIDSPVFTFIIKSLYGTGVSKEDILRRWVSTAIIQGVTQEGGISDEECVLVEVEPFVEPIEEEQPVKKKKRKVAKTGKKKREKPQMRTSKTKTMKLWTIRNK